jgi:hypothetical protein
VRLFSCAPANLRTGTFYFNAACTKSVVLPKDEFVSGLLVKGSCVFSFWERVPPVGGCLIISASAQCQIDFVVKLEHCALVVRCGKQFVLKINDLTALENYHIGPVIELHVS